MKTLVKNFSKWGLVLLLGIGLQTAFAQRTSQTDDPDPVIIVQKKIIKLEDQLESLRMLSKADMTRQEKKAYKREKRAVRRALNQQRELLARMTSRGPWGPYPYGYYGSVWTYGNPYFNPYVRPVRFVPRPRVVVVNPPHRHRHLEAVPNRPLNRTSKSNIKP